LFHSRLFTYKDVPQQLEAVPPCTGLILDIPVRDLPTALICLVLLSAYLHWSAGGAQLRPLLKGASPRRFGKTETKNRNKKQQQKQQILGINFYYFRNEFSVALISALALFKQASLRLTVVA